MGPIFSWKWLKTKPSRLYHLQITPILVSNCNIKTSYLLTCPEIPFEISKWHTFWQYVAEISSNFPGKMAKPAAYSLIPPSNHINISPYLKYKDMMSTIWSTIPIWKFEVSHIFEKSRWRTSSFFLVLHNHIQWNLSHISFFGLFGRDYDVFPRTWCHYKGIPPKIGDSPRKTRFRPISSRNVHYDTLIWSYDSCSVENFI